MKSSLRVMIATVAMAALAFCADNTLGTWKLNSAKSKAPVGSSPFKSLTIVRAAAGDAVKVSAKGEREDGTKVDYSYTGKYDGKPVTVSGSGIRYDTIAIKQGNADTLTDIRTKKGGKYKVNGKFAVSKDGKSATFSTKGVGEDGKPIETMLSYDKQ